MSQIFDDFHEERVYQEQLAVLLFQQRPSVLFRPTIRRDGNQFCALYGENLMHGVAGFGQTADEAMRDFDARWYTERIGKPCLRFQGEAGGNCRVCGLIAYEHEINATGK